LDAREEKLTSLPSLAVVTRTIGTRTEELQRNLKTVEQLKLKWQGVVNINHIVTLPSDVELPARVGEHVSFAIYERQDKGDTRWTGIEAGFSCAQTDYIMFLDDDDWIEIGEDNLLAELISKLTFDEFWIPARMHSSRPFAAKFASALGGIDFYDPAFFHYSASPTVNLTPFPCVIYRRLNLDAATQFLGRLRPIFREDHMLFCLSGLSENRAKVDSSLIVRIAPNSSPRSRAQRLERRNQANLATTLLRHARMNKAEEKSKFSWRAQIRRLRLRISHEILALGR
jgi:hypothetical protein